MEVFRLSREMYAVPLSGKGAAIKGARWNSIGVELVYTAKNRSLAMAEVAVHLTLATLPPDYCMVTINIPDDIGITEIPLASLPADWNSFPHPLSTQQFGDTFVRANAFCALMVPSAVTQGDFNVLLNPGHKDFGRITITEVVKFPFDKRIFK